jgi:hypothetical protein
LLITVVQDVEKAPGESPELFLYTYMRFSEWLDNFLVIYRGESVHNRGGRYWTTDKEWARQFTQSGRDFEIKTARIDPSKIYKMDPLPSASSESDFDRAIEAAQEAGFPAVWFDEGRGEPNSIYVIRKSILR